MPATKEIYESLIRENVVRAVVDVFDTMLASPIALSHPEGVSKTLPPRKPEDTTPQVVGIVGFIGDINGMIYLYFESPFAVDCTAKMLGMTPSEARASGDEVVNDAIGELTNMIVGSFKNSLCDSGFPCKLTVPSILRGLDFRIEPISSAQRYIYSFTCSGRHLVADVLMTGDPQ